MMRFGAAKLLVPTRVGVPINRITARPSLTINNTSRHTQPSTPMRLIASSSLRSSSTPSAPSKAGLYQSPLREEQQSNNLLDDGLILESSSTGTHKYGIIWLHDIAQKVETLTTMMTIMQPPHTKLLVPQAPKISLTCLPNEPDQYGWFDMLHEKLDVQKENAGEIMEEDEIGLEQMTSRIHALLDAELLASGLPSHRLLLAGFGQGGCLALHAGLTWSKPLAGIVSIAGYLPKPNMYQDATQVATLANKDTPVLAIHGNSDFIVPIAFAKRRYEILKKSGVKVDLKTEWSMGHFLSNASLMGSQGWMVQQLERADQRVKK